MLDIKPLEQFFEENGLSQDSDVLKKINWLRRSAKIEFDIEGGPWIAGGSVLKLAEGLPLGFRDIDIFFPSEERFNRYREQLDKLADSEEAKLHREKKSASRSPYSREPIEDKIFRTSKAYTYNLEKVQAQIIRRCYYDNAYELLGDFDFTICMFATDGKNIAYFPQGLEDAKNKSLRIHRIHRESILIKRFYKYLANGYTPLPGEVRLLHEVVREDPAKYAKDTKEYISSNVHTLGWGY